MNLPTGPLHLWNPQPNWGQPVPQGKKKRILGVDLGQKGDPSAAVAIDCMTYPSGFVGPRVPYWRVVNVKEWESNTKYDAVMDEIIRAVGVDVAVVDYGGVGQSWVDFLMREARKANWQAKIAPVYTIGGKGRGSIHNAGSVRYRTANKVDIIGALQIAIEQKTLQLPKSPETAKLIDEMRLFQYHSPTRNGVKMEASTGNDDLVFALALGCWWLHNFGRGEAYIS